MNIGILGSSGYLGSNIAHALEGRHKVTRLSLRRDCQLDQTYVGEWGKTDIIQSGLEVLVVCTSPDAKTCNEEPIETLKLVLVKLERFVRNAAECGVSRIVYLSTCRVYKDGVGQITENSEVTYGDMYSVSHLAGESMLKDVCLSQGVSGACFRLSNVFGTQVKSHEDSPMWQLAANSFIFDIARKRTIYIKSPDARRDFVPVSVVVKAVKSYIEGNEVGGHFDIINIASGFTVSMLEARDVLVRIGSGTLTESSIEAELGEIRDRSGTRRIIEGVKAKQLGLFDSRDVHEGYVEDTLLTIRLASGEYR